VTSAPIAQQRLLIDLQDLDSRLARLRHERKHLPVLTRIESVIERLKTNKRAAIQAEAALDEAKKRATRSEDEVSQVVRRAEVLGRPGRSRHFQSRRNGGHKTDMNSPVADQ